MSRPRLCRRLRYGPRMGIGFTVGRLDVEAGGMLIRKGPLWLPDGLHVHWGDRGVHMFWHGSPYARRITFTGPLDLPTIPDPPKREVA